MVAVEEEVVDQAEDLAVDQVEDLAEALVEDLAEAMAGDLQEETTQGETTLGMTMNLMMRIMGME